MSTTFPKMHISLYVNDILETVNFYTSFFGKPADKVKKDYAKYILDEPALIISFIENPERVQENFGHLGFQVASKEEVLRRLDAVQKMNIKTLEEMGTSCCYAIQDKFWVTDPSGVQWEIYYFHQDTAFNDPHYETGESNACCMPPEKEEKKKVALAEISENSCAPGSGCC